jgi:protein-tyrosine phosphatase
MNDLEHSLASGKTVALHCRQGIGRSSLIAACLLVTAGEEPRSAFERIGSMRGVRVPETPEQEQWVLDSASALAIHPAF